jgi:hypothetical protein
MEPPVDSVGDEARRSVRAFLAIPENAGLLHRLELDLGLSTLAIEHAFVRYALESLSSSNDIYDDVGIHVAMWIEYQAERSLHARRQAVVLNELRRRRPATTADIGFGAPTRYLRDYVLPTPSASAKLFDKYPAALEVGRAIMKYWSEQHAAKVEFALHDMDTDPPVSGFDCYLMLDAVEHAAQPDRYLAETVSAANDEALFLFHMPIGPLITSHTIAWNNAHDATLWLAAAGLEVSHTEFIYPNLEVDLFARGGVTLENLFVVAHKVFTVSRPARAAQPR